MIKVREKSAGVYDALQFMPEVLPMAAYDAFLGDYAERIEREAPRGAWLLRGPSGYCFWMTSEDFLDKYVQVAVGEEQPPPAPLSSEQLIDLSEAALDALQDHDGFAELWRESPLQQRQATRRRVRDAMKEAAS